MAGLELPARAIREQMSSALHLVVQTSRMPDGSRRVTHVTEVAGMESELVTLQDIFLFRQQSMSPELRVQGEFVATGIRPAIAERFGVTELWGERS
jgi:pilus assembly protein CpaF